MGAGVGSMGRVIDGAGADIERGVDGMRDGA
jgi:hypothetical protein